MSLKSWSKSDPSAAKPDCDGMFSTVPRNTSVSAAGKSVTTTTSPMEGLTPPVTGVPPNDDGCRADAGVLPNRAVDLPEVDADRRQLQSCKTYDH
jgi:hypothetical protein